MPPFLLRLCLLSKKLQLHSSKELKSKCEHTQSQISITSILLSMLFHTTKTFLPKISVSTYIEESWAFALFLTGTWGKEKQNQKYKVFKVDIILAVYSHTVPLMFKASDFFSFFFSDPSAGLFWSFGESPAFKEETLCCV